MMDYLFLMSLLLVSNDIISPIKESKKENHASCVMETVNHAPPCSVPNLHLKGLSLDGSRIMLVI